MVSIRSVDSILDVPRDEWDALAGNQISVSHGWLKTVEENTDGVGRPIYYLAEESGRMVAATICNNIERGGKYRSLDGLLFGRMAAVAFKAGLSFLPATECGQALGYGSNILIRSGLAPEKVLDITDRLLVQVEERAAHESRALYLDRISDNQPELIRLLDRRGYLKTLGYPMNILTIGFSTFDDYVNSLEVFGRNSRKVVRREINKNRREGVVIEEMSDPSECESRLHDLLDLTHRKYNNTNIPFRRGFLSALKSNLGPEAVIYSARKGGRVIGAAVLLRRNDYGYIPMVGVDHEAAGNDFTYFNLAYYRPVRDAIQWRVKEVQCGAGMNEVKRRRGCQIRNTYLFYRSFNRLKQNLLKPYFNIHSAWWRRKISSIGSEKART